MVKKKLKIIGLCFFLVLTLSFVLANDNSSINETMNLTVGNETDSINETIEESDAGSQTLENGSNETINQIIGQPDNLTIGNETVEATEDSDVGNETLEESVEEINEPFFFGIMEDVARGIMNLANSTSYKLDMFLLGIHAIKTTYEGNYVIMFSSFSDGRTGNAASASYTANIGPIGQFTGYQACERQTCSQFGYTCARWEDSCGGYLNCGTCAGSYNCFTGVCMLDADNDSVADSVDTLIGGVDNIDMEGLTNANVTIGGNSTNGTFSGEQEVIIYDGTDIVVSYTHNFSAAAINFSKLHVTKTTNGVVVNFSDQLPSGETKTIYIDDNSFSGLCVEDAEISSVDNISSGCDGTNETSFASCLGNSTGVTLGGINCTDLGSRIKIDGLNHSGVLGTVASTTTTTTTTSSGGSISDCIKGDVFKDGKCVKIEVEENVTGEVPLQLFDIAFNLEDRVVRGVDELVAVVTFESFGNVPTLVSLRFIILDEDGNGVYREESEIIVSVEEVLRWHYRELDLAEGKYVAILETVYNTDVIDEFRQNFEIKKKESVVDYLEENWEWEVLVVVGVVLVILAILFVRRKKILKKKSPRKISEKERKLLKDETEKFKKERSEIRDKIGKIKKEREYKN